jgi:RNA polymerase sigma-70 factor (ECF subfamily)
VGRGKKIRDARKCFGHLSTFVGIDMKDSFADFLARLQARNDTAAQELFERFTGQLIAMARRRFATGPGHKVDPESVVQSAYKSFFHRYDEGKFELGSWDSLWGLLTLITMRKCAQRAAYYQAECRDPAREVSAPVTEAGASWREPLGREPTPLEAAELAETVERLFAAMDEEDRPVLELSLQGYTTREISERLGRAERTVRLLREGIRKRLERMQQEHP